MNDAAATGRARAEFDRILRERGCHAGPGGLQCAACWWQDLNAEAAALLPETCTLDSASNIRDLGGDPHSDRFPVLISWYDQEWIYKPRSSWGEALLDALLCKVGSEVGITWPAQDIRQGVGSSWVRPARLAPVQDADEAGDFFRASGCLLAVAHYLRLGDLNHENIVAAGTRPIVIDAEVIFRPTLHGLLPPERRDNAEHWQRSVLGTSMLPLSTSPAEPSGLGIAGGSRDARGVWSQSEHLPLLDGRRVFPECHADDVLTAYRSTAKALRGMKDVVLSLIERFEDRPVRLMVRDTSEYAAAMQWYETAGRGDPKELVRRLEYSLDHESPMRLAHPEPRAGLDKGISDRRRRVCELEAEAISAGRVPLFTADIRGTTLSMGQGREVEGVLTASPLDQWAEHEEVLSNAPRVLEEDSVRHALGRHPCRLMDTVS